MRHAKKRFQLGRFTSWHDATIKSLSRNILINQSIKTTLSRAKAARQQIEGLVSLSKKNSLSGRRQAQKILGEHKLVNLLFNEIGPRFKDRSSGFTRIINLGRRRGDDAQMVIFELTEIKKKEPKKPKAAKEQKAHAKEPHEAKEAAEEKKEKAPEAKKESKAAIKEIPAIEKKPQKKFMGGFKNIFKKERDSL